MKKTLKRLFLILGVIFLLVELMGRFYGLHDYPTYIDNDTYEYIHAPHQDKRIYRKKFITNAFSMRNTAIEEGDTTVVLLIGDSVINGGNMTDHDSLATSILERALTQSLGESVRVLNISAGSWGPDNAKAYIESHGTFHADMMVLVVSSHDAYDNITHQKMVGVHPQFPEKNYSLAWGKLLERGWQQVARALYTGKNPTKVRNSNLGITRDTSFNSGFEYFANLRDELAIPLLVYLHPNSHELNIQEYVKVGTEIIDFCEEEDIQLIKELNLGINAVHYRDQIHYSEQGQRFLANNLFPILRDSLEKIRQ